MTIEEKVMNYPTKNEMGFLKEEIEQLLLEYPDLDRERFDNALLGVTCVADENMRILIFHCDIVKAIQCGVEKRALRSYEWD